MVKVITITDEAYEKLRKLKERKGMSFSQAILWLLSVAKTKERKPLLYELEGALEMNVLKRRLRKIYRW